MKLKKGRKTKKYKKILQLLQYYVVTETSEVYFLFPLKKEATTKKYVYKRKLFMHVLNNILWLLRIWVKKYLRRTKNQRNREKEREVEYEE